MMHNNMQIYKLRVSIVRFLCATTAVRTTKDFKNFPQRLLPLWTGRHVITTATSNKSITNLTRITIIETPDVAVTNLTHVTITAIPDATVTKLTCITTLFCY